MALTPLQRSRQRVKQLQADIAKIKKAQQQSPITALQGLINKPSEARGVLEDLGPAPLFTPMDPNALESETSTRLQNTIQPGINAIERGRANSLHNYNVQSRTAMDWGESMMRGLSGGQTGQAGMDHANAQYANPYLPALAANQTTTLLSQIGRDFNETDWKYVDALAEMMDKIPGLRQEIQADIVNRHKDDYKTALTSYETRAQVAGLLVNQINKDRDFEYGVVESIRDQRNKDTTFDITKEQMGQEAEYRAGTLENQRAATRIADRRVNQNTKNARAREARLQAESLSRQTGTVHVVKNGRVVNTGKKTVAAKREDRMANTETWRRDNLTAYQQKLVAQADKRIEQQRKNAAAAARGKGKGATKDGLTPKQTAYNKGHDGMRKEVIDLVGTPMEAPAKMPVAKGSLLSKPPQGKYIARPGTKGVFPDGTTDEVRLARRGGVVPFNEAVNILYDSYAVTLSSHGWSQKEIRGLALSVASSAYNKYRLPTERGAQKRKPARPTGRKK
jgi:hypothetical protein